MLKNLLLTGAALCCAYPVSASQNFRYFETDARLETHGLGFDTKLNINSPDRQFGIDYSTNYFTIRYEREEAYQSKYNVNRISLSYFRPLFKHEKFTLSAGLQVAGILPDAPSYSNDNWLRISPYAVASYNISTPLSVYTSVNSHLAVAKNYYSAFQLNTLEYRPIGISYAINNNLSVGAFTQLNTNSALRLDAAFAGVGIALKF